MITLQTGFLSVLYITSALLQVINYIFIATGINQYTVAILIDLSKAFNPQPISYPGGSGPRVRRGGGREVSPRGDVSRALGERRLRALPKRLHRVPPAVPAGHRRSDSPLTAHYHYLSVMAASGGHRKGQGTFVRRISSNISGGKYISPVLNGARRGKRAGSRARAPCSFLHLVHLSPRRLPQHRAAPGDTHFTPPALLLMLLKWMT